MISVPPSDRRIDLPGRAPCVEVVDNAMTAIYLQKEEWERQDIASNLWESARRFLGETIQLENPDWGEDQIRREILRRLGRPIPDSHPIKLDD